MRRGLGLLWLLERKARLVAAVYQSLDTADMKAARSLLLSYPLLRAIQMVTTAIVNDKGVPDRNNPKYYKLTKK